jgi:hypothetical protein
MVCTLLSSFLSLEPVHSVLTFRGLIFHTSEFCLGRVRVFHVVLFGFGFSYMYKRGCWNSFFSFRTTLIGYMCSIRLLDERLRSSNECILGWPQMDLRRETT